ncbi:MAG: 1-acyl-sn-glycerol-3-phosphate acyltransferase [Halobacteriovoraceae bacterium]|nr:1-acyl-sn-glycerol-3-phosphate acyltransferase [Halobacteriovoraceae bacterium]|tara:strand:+ start:137 stop:937 length:801 start_codon:yes stop_codon:yes gene_type:complete
MKLLKYTQALLRAFFFLIIILTYFCSAGIFYPYYIFNPMKARHLLCRIVSFYCKVGIKLLGFQVSENYRIDKLKLVDHNFFIVSNHLSYMDILVMCSQHPACFVTSVEMRDTPFLGHLCKLAGCVFVERRNKRNLGGEVAEITQALKEGLNVVVFPEATSTNGEGVIRFKRPLFRAAMDSNIPILPMTVNYTHLNGEKVTKENRDYICWYGDMTFVDHLWKLFTISITRASLTISEIVRPRDYENDLENLVLMAHDRVEENFIPFT